MTSNGPIKEPALRMPRHPASTLSGWRNAFRRHREGSGVSGVVAWSLQYRAAHEYHEYALQQPIVVLFVL